MIPRSSATLHFGLYSGAPAGARVAALTQKPLVLFHWTALMGKNADLAREQLPFEACGHSEQTRYGAVERL
jgi:hypothetical protein